MITTKAGKPIKIVDGSKKSITGRKPFTVEYILTPEELLNMVAKGGQIRTLGNRFKLQRTEMLFENEQELYDALGLTKE